jgi:hypothetical protein
LNEPQVKVYIYRARLFMKNYLVSMDRVVWQDLPASARPGRVGEPVESR